MEKLPEATLQPHVHWNQAPAAPQPLSPAAPQPHSPAALQSHSPMDPQPRSSMDPQTHRPTDPQTHRPTDLRTAHLVPHRPECWHQERVPAHQARLSPCPLMQGGRGALWGLPTPTPVRLPLTPKAATPETISGEGIRFQTPSFEANPPIQSTVTTNGTNEGGVRAPWPPPDLPHPTGEQGSPAGGPGLCRGPGTCPRVRSGDLFAVPAESSALVSRHCCILPASWHPRESSIPSPNPKPHVSSVSITPLGCFQGTSVFPEMSQLRPTHPLSPKIVLFVIYFFGISFIVIFISLLEFSILPLSSSLPLSHVTSVVWRSAPRNPCPALGCELFIGALSICYPMSPPCAPVISDFCPTFYLQHFRKKVCG